MTIHSETKYFVKFQKKSFFGPFHKLRKFFKIQNGQLFASIACRLFMLAHIVYVVIQTVQIFNESILYANLVFIPLIVIDAYVVVYERNGLEDRRCNSPYYFTSAQI